MADQLADAMARALTRLTKPGDRNFLASLATQHASGRQLSAKQLAWAVKLIQQADEPAPVTEFTRVERDIFAERSTPIADVPKETPATRDWVQKNEDNAAETTLNMANEQKLADIISRQLGHVKADLVEVNDARERDLKARQDAFNNTAAKSIAKACVAQALKELDARVPRQSVITVKRVDLSEYKVAGPKHPNFEKLLKYCTVRKADGFVPGIFLAGERGSGKTTGCRLAAQALGMTWYTNGAIAFDTQMLGYVDAVGKYHTTPFRQAFEHGGFYCFDEVDRSDPNALLSVNPHLANGEAAFPDGMVRRHPDCVIVATGNTWGLGGSLEFSGATKLDEAFLSRFEIKLPWDVDREFERKLVANDAWYAFVEACRQRVRSAGMKYTIDSRAAIVGSNLIAQLGYTVQQAAEETFLSSIKPDQRRIVMGEDRP